MIHRIKLSRDGSTVTVAPRAGRVHFTVTFDGPLGMFRPIEQPIEREVAAALIAALEFALEELDQAHVGFLPTE